jgi:hypothetical protein
VNIKHVQRRDVPAFLDAASIDEILKSMEEDPQLKTVPVLVKDETNSVQLVSFREKHSTYLREHPKVNPENYLSNLRTMIKIRN